MSTTIFAVQPIVNQRVFYVPEAITSCGLCFNLMSCKDVTNMDRSPKIVRLQQPQRSDPTKEEGNNNLIHQPSYDSNNRSRCPSVDDDYDQCEDCWKYSVRNTGKLIKDMSLGQQPQRSDPTKEEGNNNLIHQPSYDSNNRSRCPSVDDDYDQCEDCWKSSVRNTGKFIKDMSLGPMRSCTASVNTVRVTDDDIAYKTRTVRRLPSQIKIKPASHATSFDSSNENIFGFDEGYSRNKTYGLSSEPDITSTDDALSKGGSESEEEDSTSEKYHQLTPHSLSPRRERRAIRRKRNAKALRPNLLLMKKAILIKNDKMEVSPVKSDDEIPTCQETETIRIPPTTPTPISNPSSPTSPHVRYLIL